MIYITKEILFLRQFFNLPKKKKKNRAMNHMWLLGTWNVARMTNDYYFIAIEF